MNEKEVSFYGKESFMKKWRKYKKYLLKGDWHIHTNYVDGKNTIEECCIQAEKNHLELIVFTEHVRKNMTYCFDDYLSNINEAREKFDIIILGGSEAKILENGNLDISKDVLDKSEIVIASFHSFPPDKNKYLDAFKKTMSNSHVDIWGHPTLFFERNNIKLDTSELRELAQISKKNDVLIEINKNHDVPKSVYNTVFKDFQNTFVMGSDAHNIDEILNRGDLK